MGIIVKIEYLRRELNTLIESNNYCLQDVKIIWLSQELDKYISVYQSGYDMSDY